MSILNNVVGYWAYIRGTYIRGAYIRVGLYSGGGAYIWNEVILRSGIRRNITLNDDISLGTKPLGKYHHFG